MLDVHSVTLQIRICGTELAPKPGRSGCVGFFWGQLFQNRTVSGDLAMLAYIFAIATGLSAAGLVGSGWLLLTGEPVYLGLLGRRGVLLPLRTLVLVFAGPVILLNSAVRMAVDEGRPVGFWCFSGLAAGWAFVEGVTILVVFGVL